MHRRRNATLSPWWGWVGLSMGLVGCGGGADDPSISSPPTASSRQAAVVSPAQPSNTTGRLLASNCFQCHGTGGMGGLEKIRGGEVSEVREYRDLLRRPANQDIMAAHAQGYTDAQIAAIIQYLQQ